MKRKNFISLIISVIALVIFIIMMCTSCSNETPKDKNGVSVADYDIKGNCDIVTIGNHEYLYYRSGYAGSLCHYADCKYCARQHNGKFID
jgi:hypothetical protein